MTQILETGKTSQGIQELVDLMREKGINAGKEEGTRIVAEAEKRAEWILAQAEQQAQELSQSAHQQAEFIKQSGAESLEMAFRDIKLKLKDELSSRFATQLQRLVNEELSDPQTLKQLLISAAAKTQIQDQAMTIQLPDNAVALKELREDPDLLKGGPLMEMLSEVSRSLFSAGVSLQTSGSADQGLTFLLRDGEITIELTDAALSKLLLAHLQPRFRAILEGVVA
jgi:V/A-type H+-transporting ATPase subunit E